MKFPEAGQRTEKKQLLGNCKANSSQNSYSIETKSDSHQPDWKYLVRGSVETPDRSNLYSGAKLDLYAIRLC